MVEDPSSLSFSIDVASCGLGKALRDDFVGFASCAAVKFPIWLFEDS